MEIDIRIRSIHEFREFIREFEYLCCHRPRRGRVTFVVGDSLQEVEKMSISNLGIAQGQRRWLKATFEDGANNVHPLAALPTAVDSAGVLTLTPVGAAGATPAPTDPAFFWQVDCPAGATAGATGTITISGQNQDGTPDNTTVPYTVNAADDTVVDVEVQDVAP